MTSLIKGYLAIIPKSRYFNILPESYIVDIMIRYSELIIRFVVGGSLIVAISLLAKSKYPQLAGLAVLFPAVTIIGYFFLLSSQGVDSVRPIILFSIYSVPTVFAFLATLYIALKRFGIAQSILLSIMAWLAVALIFLFLEQRFFEIAKNGSQI